MKQPLKVSNTCWYNSERSRDLNLSGGVFQNSPSVRLTWQVTKLEKPVPRKLIIWLFLFPDWQRNQYCLLVFDELKIQNDVVSNANKTVLRAAARDHDTRSKIHRTISWTRKVKFSVEISLIFVNLIFKLFFFNLYLDWFNFSYILQ